MRKKILSMLLALCMVFNLMPVSALAEEGHIDIDTLTHTGSDMVIGEELPDTGNADERSNEDNGNQDSDIPAMMTFSPVSTVTGSAISYEVWVGGVEINSENYTNVTGSTITAGTVSYDPDNYTLTLDGAVISGSYDDSGNMYAIYSNHDLIIQTVNSSSHIGDLLEENQQGDSIGIYVSGDLSIYASSQLYVSVGKATDGSNYGIKAEGDIFIQKGEVSVTTHDASETSYGIALTVFNVILRVDSGASLMVHSGEARNSYGIYIEGDLSDMYVLGEANIRASSASAGMSCGIFFEDWPDTTLEINGKLEAYGGDYGYINCGVHTTGMITISGNDALLRAVSYDADHRSYAILASQFNVYGGEVWAFAGPGIDSVGIHGLIIIYNGTVNASGNNESGEAKAISCSPSYDSKYEPLIWYLDDDGERVYISEEEYDTSYSLYKQITIERYVTYDVWVGGERVTSRNMHKISGTGIAGDVSYSPETNTLTLINATITGTYADSIAGREYAIYVPGGGLNIAVLGDNNSITSEANIEDVDSIGIYIYGDLTLNGDPNGNSRLVVNDGATTRINGDSIGIYVDNGNLTIEKLELLASGAPVEGSGASSIGIDVHDGNIDLSNNARVTANGASADRQSIGLHMCHATLSRHLDVDSNCSLEANGGETEDVSYGIVMEEGHTYNMIIDGKVTAKGGSALNESSGIILSSTTGSGWLELRGSLEASGASSTKASFGISCSDIRINGELLAYSGAVDSSVGGISKALTSAPVFLTGYFPYILAGNNAVNAVYKENIVEFQNSIDDYRYVAIEPLIEYDIWVGDIRVTNANKGNITCDHIEQGAVIYDSDSNTLILREVMLTDAYTDIEGNKYGIYAEGDLNIERIGHSAVTVSSPAVGKDSAGIHVCGNLTILGDGELVVTSSPTTGGSVESTGLHVDNGDLVVEGGKLIAYGASAGGTYSGSYGICVHDGDMIIKDNAEVEVSGSESDSSSTGLYVEGDLIVERGILVASGGESNDKSYGIALYADEMTYTHGNLIINEYGIVRANGKQAIDKSIGMHIEGNLTVEGGSLEANGGTSVGESYGIFSTGMLKQIQLNGGSLTAGGGSGAGGSYGIEADDVLVTNGTLEASGGETAGDSYGLSMGGFIKQVIVEGGSLTATGGSADGVSYGIGALVYGGFVQLNGGSLTAIGGSADDESYGISAENVIVNQGTLDVGGGDAVNRSFGISISQLDINGGYVIAYSGAAEGLSQAMNLAPTFGSNYNHLNNAGTNGGDAVYVTDEELENNINSYRYIEIIPYTPSGGNGGDNGNGGSYSPAPPTEPTGPIVAPVDSNGNASISFTEQDMKDAILRAKAEVARNGSKKDGLKLSINVTTDGESASGFTLNLPKAIQEQIINNEITEFELCVDGLDITIGINLSALKEIYQQANADVQISVSQTDSSELSTEAQDEIGDRPVYVFKVSYQEGSKDVSDFGSGLIYVSIPYTPADNENVGYLYIVYVDDKGNTSRVYTSAYDDNSKSLIFITNHFSVYGVGYSEPSAKFSDIDTHWAKDSIDYVVSRELLTGTTKTEFSPDSGITRAELATALGKLADIDTAEYTTKSFKDVKADNPNRPYIEWAYSKGILEGIGNGKFGPNRTMTHEELALIMANYVKVMNYKLPLARAAVEFSDTSAINKLYSEAVKSMVQAGIMMCHKDNEFKPKEIATRAELSNILYRLIKLTLDPASVQGWVQDYDGQFMYYKDSKVLTGWQTIDGAEYFFNTDGSLKTGWVKDEAGNMRYYTGKEMVVGFRDIGAKGKKKTYYFDTKGVMVSGKWLEIDGKWYYFKADGVMAKGTKIDEFELDENGVRITN